MTDTHPLTQLIALEQDARAFGFDWPDLLTIVAQAESECVEIRETIAANESAARLQEEIGDLLHTAVSLCLFAGFDPEQTLAGVNEKFGLRMRKLKQIALSKGYTHVGGQDFDKLLMLWDEAKSQIKAEKE